MFNKIEIEDVSSPNVKKARDNVFAIDERGVIRDGTNKGVSGALQEGQLGRAGELVNIGGQKLEGPLAIVEPSQIQLLPNRIPSDIPNPVPRNRLFFNGERWKYVTPQGKVLTPKGRYNFVTIDGQIYISRQTSINGGHIDIARGASVEFAGQIRFGKGKYTRGILKGWNDDSGHFRPGLDFPIEQLIPQSRLPLDRFQSFETPI